jgi:hypothetical protein
MTNKNNRYSIRGRDIWLGVIVLSFLAACQGSDLSTPTASITPLESPLPSHVSPTQSLTPTFEPTLNPTVTITPTHQSLYPIINPQEILTSDFKSEAFHNLILFTSAYYQPFPDINFQKQPPWPDQNMFAFSPDGQRAGVLNPADFASLIYLPPDPSQKPLLVEYGVKFEHPSVQGVELPPECYQATGNADKLFPCANFQFSPDGRYLGFFYGPPECLRGIIIQDVRTGEQVYKSEGSNGHYFTLLKNGKALIATGHCEGGGVTLYDFINKTKIDLGGEGNSSWNADLSALAVEVHSYSGIDSTIWGFNFESNRFFLSVPKIYQIDDHPVWTPDKNYLLYQHRTYTRASDGYSPTGFDTPRQIILVNARSGEQKIILSSPEYDFHLGSCPYSHCTNWYGNWIQVRRIAFKPEPLTGGLEVIGGTPLYTCPIIGENCPVPTELFGLNWKTGELIPWEKLIQNNLIPNPTPKPGPDPSANPIYTKRLYALYAGPKAGTYWMDRREEGGVFLTGPDLANSPIYKNPDGLYAFYVGIDGKTLWMVPAKGDPVLWVLEGQNYFYIP